MFIKIIIISNLYIEIKKLIFLRNYILYLNFFFLSKSNNIIFLCFNFQNNIRFAGRVIAKALFDGFLTNCSFTRSFYKLILGHQLTLEDVKDLDHDFFNNLTWILDNKINGELHQQFRFS